MHIKAAVKFILIHFEPWIPFPQAKGRAFISSAMLKIRRNNQFIINPIDKLRDCDSIDENDFGPP